MTLLDEMLEGWDYARMSVLAEAEALPDEGYAYRPHPRSRSFAELMLHIVESGQLMVGELTRPDGDFTRKPYLELVKEHAGDLPEEPDPAGIRALLERTLQEGKERFLEVGEVHMLQLIRRFDGERGSRLAWMCHGIQHEEYHRGQAALYVRLQGHVPALTRAIYGAEAR